MPGCSSENPAAPLLWEKHGFPKVPPVITRQLQFNLDSYWIQCILGEEKMLTDSDSKFWKITLIDPFLLLLPKACCLLLLTTCERCGFEVLLVQGAPHPTSATFPVEMGSFSTRADKLRGRAGRRLFLCKVWRTENSFPGSAPALTCEVGLRSVIYSPPALRCLFLWHRLCLSTISLMRFVHACRPYSHITPTDALLNRDRCPGPCCQDIIICPLCCLSLSHSPTYTPVSTRFLGPSNFQQGVGRLWDTGGNIPLTKESKLHI